MSPATVRAASLTLALLCLAPGVRAASEPRVRSSETGREEIALTVYNRDFGLVREVRRVELGAGPVRLEFAGVASTLQPETVHVRSLADRGGLRVLEQSYLYDLLEPRKLLEKYVGRRVKLYRWNRQTGRDEEFDAEVLAVNGSPILKIGDEITFGLEGRYAFPEIPGDLIAEPTLSWLLEGGRRRERLEVSYLAGGLGWKADYVLVLGRDDELADLTGWVTVTNQSGASYEGARLKLVAGDVQRVSDGRRATAPYEIAAMAEATRADDFREESFFEYHLYALERALDLRNAEQKQVTLLDAPGVGAERRLIYHGAAHWFRAQHGGVVSNRKVGVFLDIENRDANGLGRPLPAGIVRVYQADSDGAQQFVGEDRIDHTPRDERLRIRVGDAFDVVGERRQMAWRPLGGCVAESDWEIELRNHKEQAVEVEVVEPVGGDWQVTGSTHPPERRNVHTLAFAVGVPAGGETELSYSIRVRWC